MANKERGEVTLELGGESYVLVPSFGAVCEIEDALGANLFTLGRRLALAEITAREVIDLAH
ncbi:MAG: GTA-gp10 family protein, partial [Kiloniellales bacterium]